MKLYKITRHIFRKVWYYLRAFFIVFFRITFMNIRWNVYLAVVALVLLGWFYQLNQQDNNLQSLIKQPDSPDYVGEKMSMTVFSPTGKKQYSGYSSKVDYFESDGHTNFSDLGVYLYEIESHSANRQSWYLRADSAVLTKDKILTLTGNVVADSLLKDSKLQRIETKSARVNLNNQDIFSDDEVKIIGLNFNTTGQKLIGNLRQQTVTLKEQVRTHYEISQ